MKLGYIGIGLMGKPMVLRLLADLEDHLLFRGLLRQRAEGKTSGK